MVVVWKKKQLPENELHMLVFGVSEVVVLVFVACCALCAGGVALQVVCDVKNSECIWQICIDVQF
jgi:hypothetical protein